MTEKEKSSQVYLRYDRLGDKLVLVQYYGEEAMMSRVELKVEEAAAVIHAMTTLLVERLALIDRETVNEEILKFIYRRGEKGLSLEEYERNAATALGVSDWVVRRWREEVLDGQPIPEILLQVVNVKQVKNDLYYRELRPQGSPPAVEYQELTVGDFIELEEKNESEHAQEGSESGRVQEKEKFLDDPVGGALSSGESLSFYSGVLFD